MNPPLGITRREALLWLGAAGAAGCVLPRAAAGAKPLADDLVVRNDAALRDLLPRQLTAADAPMRGSVPDAVGFCTAQSAAGLIETAAAAYVHPRSAFAGDAELLARIGLAAGFLERAQSPRGNIDLLVTNFDSPPDTGFCVHGVATAAAIGRRHGHEQVTALLRPFLQRAGGGLSNGGIHTPNHRWVVSSALAQIHELFPDERYLRRIDQWLAEGIDIDADGQFTERSTLVYNPVTDRALVVMADKLQRPELLEPVRANLRSLPWLLHADGELVTEISRRQDQFARGGVGRYWFPLALLAARDQDGQFAAMASQAAATDARLSTVLEYPELGAPASAPVPLPDDFARLFLALGIGRLRRGPRSATILLRDWSRLCTLRHGDAVLDGVRMAAAFFGKGQFVPDGGELQDGVYRLHQALEAPYYQPLTETVTPETWLESRERRAHSEVCQLQQEAEIRETGDGLQLRLRAHGTVGVPLAVELCFRDGGQLEGCCALEGAPDCFALEGEAGVYRAGRNSIRFGPGALPHRYVQVRGAEPKLPGTSVYLTGFTPFDHTITFACS